VKLRFLFLLTICHLYFAPLSPSFSQNIRNKTVIKAAMESGPVNLNSFFGDGTLYRGILRVQSKIMFSKSYLLLKTRFSKEYFNIAQTINTLHQQGDLVFVKYYKRDFLQLNATFNNHSSSLDSLGKQDIREWQLRGMLSKGMFDNYSLVIKDTYLSHDFSILNADYSKNRIMLAIDHQWPGNKSLNFGFFRDDLFFNAADTNASKDLLGVQLEYRYNRATILNVTYNYTFALENDYHSHQLNITTGKYLSGKLSMFMSMFYTWVMDEKEYLELFSRVEVFNNISMKLGYDLFNNTNIYLKGILEDHKLVNKDEKVSSRQIVLGLQQKF